MALGNIVKYSVPVVFFFYSTVIIHFIQQTGQNDSKHQLHVTINNIRDVSHKNRSLIENTTTIQAINDDGKSESHSSDNVLKFQEINTAFPYITLPYAGKYDKHTIINEMKIKSKIISRLRNNYNKMTSQNYHKSITNGNAFQQVGNDIYVFSAFYDSRRFERFNKRYVRIIAIAKLDSNENLIYKFSKETTDHPVSAIKTEMSDNHEKTYGGVIYMCSIPLSYGNLPPKVIYLQSRNNFSMVTDSFISLAIIPVNLLPWQHTMNLEEINTASTAHSNDSPNIFGTAANKKLEESERQLKIHSKERQLLIHSKERQLRNTSLSQSELSPNISVCVSPLFGNAALSNVIQFIESHLILGVSHFFFYKMQVSHDMDNLLNLYQTKGLITLIDWVLPTDLTATKMDIWYNGQVVALQDCLYRNIGRYDYTAFIDIDEVIVPYQHNTWTEMISRLNNNNNMNYAGFIFQSAFFPKDITLEQTSSTARSPSSKLSFLNSVYRTDLSTVRTKVIVKPTYIDQVGIHHVSKLIFSDYDLKLAPVPADVALIHHYRKCTQISDQQMNCGKYIKDTSLLKYADFLVRNYEKTLEEYLKIYSKYK